MKSNDHPIDNIELQGLDVSVECFPDDGAVDPKSYLTALNSFKRGDAVTVFTPDDTHFDIAMACVERGLHVLVTKPIVKTLEQHCRLHRAAIANRVLVCVEVISLFDMLFSYPVMRSMSTGTQAMGSNVY